MKRTVSLAVFTLPVAGLLSAGVAAELGGTPVIHERKEVAGLMVIFGAEPEPALTGEVQYLRWRFRSLDGEQPYDEIQGADASIRRNGVEYGLFQVRGTRSEPGLRQTMHIFTEVGEYESVLMFRKGEAPETHTVDFTFRIRDRAELEIPGHESGGTDAEAIARVLNGYAAAIEAKDLDEVGRLVTDDFLVFEGANVDKGWAEYRDDHLAPELEMFQSLTYRFSDIEAAAHGDLGWATLRYSIHIETPDRQIASDGVGSAVLVKAADGKWHLRHLHTSAERRRQ